MTTIDEPYDVVHQGGGGERAHEVVGPDPASKETIRVVAVRLCPGKKDWQAHLRLPGARQPILMSRAQNAAAREAAEKYAADMTGVKRPTYQTDPEAGLRWNDYRSAHLHGSDWALAWQAEQQARERAADVEQAAAAGWQRYTARQRYKTLSDAYRTGFETGAAWGEQQERALRLRLQTLLANMVHDIERMAEVKGFHPGPIVNVARAELLVVERGDWRGDWREGA